MSKVMKETISTLAYLLGVLCVTWLVITFVGQRIFHGADALQRGQSDCG